MLYTEVPQILKFTPQIAQPEGTSFFLICNLLSGSQPLDFRWYKDGPELGPISWGRLSIDSRATFSQLTLHNLTANDSGNYSCVASNQLGYDLQWTVLTVKGLPHLLVQLGFSTKMWRFWLC